MVEVSILLQIRLVVQIHIMDKKLCIHFKTQNRKSINRPQINYRKRAINFLPPKCRYRSMRSGNRGKSFFPSKTRNNVVNETESSLGFFFIFPSFRSRSAKMSHVTNCPKSEGKLRATAYRTDFSSTNK